MASTGRLRALKDMADVYQLKTGETLEYPGADGTPANEKALSRAYDDMLRSVLQLKVGPPADSQYWTNTYLCLRDLTAAASVLAYGKRMASTHIATMCLERARKIQLTWAERQCHFLLRQSAALQSSETDVQRHTEAIAELTEILRAEDHSEMLEQSLTAVLTKSGASGESGAADSHRRADEMLTLRQKFDRYPLHLAYFRMRSRAFQQESNLRAAIDVSKEAVAWFQAHPVFSSPARVGEFILKQFVCLLWLRDKEQATALAEETRHLLEGTTTWPTVLGYVYTLNIYDLDLAGAANVCVEMRTRAARGGSQAQRDLWKFHEVLIHVLSEAGLPGGEALGQGKFYFANVRRQLSSISRDTRGVNISLYVFDVLQLLVRHRYTEAEQAIEQFAVFTRRQLKDNSTVRTRLFARLLSRLPSHDFFAPRIRIAGREVLEMLQAESEQVDDGEYVPYERLWDVVLDVLDRNSGGTSRRR